MLTNKSEEGPALASDSLPNGPLIRASLALSLELKDVSSELALGRVPNSEKAVRLGDGIISAINLGFEAQWNGYAKKP